ncbi:Heparinase II/III-like protein [Paenibacillus konkukensis]|uniref:Heparinase II/III-like protein n=1 Tax=Paenibacillus konkukensis TaxID=2020716 RepID=A0ABY4RN13_9BACL|nr:DNRLRE domain-containing protein [Paenibacillus konkukensis]UQZ83462.1 Heparinase II/III-like protein [Paenibacillus konkukensis]
MWRKWLVTGLVSSLLFLPWLPAPKALAADPHPWFIDMTDINNRVASDAWAQTFKNNLLSKADVWLSRAPIFETDAESHYTQRPDFICVMDNAAPQYEYSTTIPSSFLCPGPDGSIGSAADNHTITAADVTPAQWTQLIHGWETRREFDQLNAILQLSFAYQLADATDPSKGLYAQKARDFLVDYSSKYVNYKRHDNAGAVEPAAVKSTAGKASVQWLDDASFFLQPGAWAYDMLFDSGYLSSSDKTAIESALRSGVALLPSTSDPDAEWSVPYNWGTVNSAAQAAVGYLLGDTTMQQRAKDGFAFQMNNQVRSDGFWWEGTMVYHNMVLDNLFILAESAYRRGASTHENLYGNANMEKMFEMLTKAAYPDGGLQMNNDSTIQTVIKERAIVANLEAANSLYGDQVYADLLNAAYSGTLRRYDLTSGTTDLYGYKAMFIGKPYSSANTAVPSPEGAYLGMQTLRLSDSTAAGDELQSTLDYGEHGGEHGHYDKLNMTLYGKGHIWGKDLGTPNYGSPLKNGWFIKTIAHNTLGIRNESQNETDAAYRVLRTSGQMHVAEAEAPGAYGSSAKYMRANVLIKPYVVDLFRVANASEVAYPAVQDANIQDGSASDTNFGSSTTITVKGINSSGTKRMAYVQMDFSRFTDPGTGKATLKLYGHNAADTATVPIDVYGIADDTWDASTMTWNSGSPNHSSTDAAVTDIGSTATLLGTLQVSNVSQYYSLDVTSFINDNIGDKKASFVLVDSSHSGRSVIFNSSENAANPPVLLIDGNSSVIYDYAYHNPNSSLSVNGVSLSSVPGALGTANGYSYIDHLQQGTTNAAWNAVFTDNADPSLKYKISMVPMNGMQVTAGLAPGIGVSPGETGPVLVASKSVASTGNTDFISVHEPFNTAAGPQAASVGLEGTAVKITRSSGGMDYVRYDLDHNMFAYVAKTPSGQVARIENIGYANVNVGGTVYFTAAAAPRTFSAAVDGSSLTVDQSPSSLGTVGVNIGSQTITSLKVNGVSVPFTVASGILTYH